MHVGESSVDKPDDLRNAAERELQQHFDDTNKVDGGQGVPTKLYLESEDSKYSVAIGVPRKRDWETKGSQV